MNPTIPFYITGLILLIVLALLFCIFYALNFAFKKLEIKKKNPVLVLTFCALFAWLIYSSAAAFNGTLLDFSSTPPKIFLIVIPASLIVIYLSISTNVNRLLTVIPAEWLVYVQSFRILMELGLWLLYTRKIIPVQMTFEGLNYDILIGLSALLIGYYTLVTEKWPRIIALLWNFAGLLLVTNIFIVSFLSTPSPLRQFFNEPANTIVSYFPFVLIPAFIVPFAYLMHILSIKQIIRNYN